MRSAPERLPAADAKKWADEASAENGGRGVPPYLIYKFDCADDDRERMYLEGEDVALVVREVDVAFDLAAAVALAREWTGEQTMEAAKFAHIPGIYQAALIEAMTGTRRFWESFLFSYWCWPSEEDSQLALVRVYPPRGLKADEVKPDEEDAGVMADDQASLMPTDIIDRACSTARRGSRCSTGPGYSPGAAMVELRFSGLPGVRQLSARRDAQRKERRSRYFLEHYDSNGMLVFSTKGLSYTEVVYVAGGFTLMRELDLRLLRAMSPDDLAGGAWLLAPRWGAPGALTVIFRGSFSEFAVPQAADRPPPHQVWADRIGSIGAKEYQLEHWPPNPDTPYVAPPAPPPMSPAELEKLKQELRKPARPIG